MEHVSKMNFPVQSNPLNQGISAVPTLLGMPLFLLAKKKLFRNIQIFFVCFFLRKTNCQNLILKNRNENIFFFEFVFVLLLVEIISIPKIYSLIEKMIFIGKNYSLVVKMFFYEKCILWSKKDFYSKKLQPWKK